MDLAAGHLAALNYLADHPGWDCMNLGTGNGYSVLDLVKAYQATSGKAIAFKVLGRRLGDVASCYAKVDKAKNLLGWQSKHSLESMCASSWKWQQFRRALGDTQ